VADPGSSIVKTLTLHVDFGEPIGQADISLGKGRAFVASIDNNGTIRIGSVAANHVDWADQPVDFTVPPVGQNPGKVQHDQNR
jgi:hypothetical protein